MVKKIKYNFFIHHDYFIFYYVNTMATEIIKKFIYDSITNNNLQDHELITNLYPIFKLSIKLSDLVIDNINDRMTTDSKKNIIHFIMLMVKNQHNYEILDNPNIVRLLNNQTDSNHYETKTCLDFLNIKRISNNYTLFFNIKDIDFCHTITINFLTLYSKANHNELLYAMIYENKNQELYAHFTECCLYFDNLAYSVPTIILSYKRHSDQIKAINKFINIAYHLKKIRNYHLLFAIMVGLSNTNITRLPYLWNDNNKTLESLNKLIDPTNNFENYKGIINKKDYFIPYLGIVMRDIKYALEDKLIDNNEVNKDLLLKLNNLVTKYKNISYSGTYIYDHGIDRFIQQINIIKDEEQLYKLSFEFHKITKRPSRMIMMQESNNIYTKSIDDWSVHDVITWLKYINLDECSKSFQYHHIDGKKLMLMNEKDFNHIGINRFGHIKLLTYELVNLLNPKLQYKNLLNKSLSSWTKHDLGSFLKYNNFEEYFNLFNNNEITGDTLPIFTIDDFQSIGVNIKDGEKIIDLIKNLKNN